MAAPSRGFDPSSLTYFFPRALSPSYAPLNEYCESQAASCVSLLEALAERRPENLTAEMLDGEWELVLATKQLFR